MKKIVKISLTRLFVKEMGTLARNVLTVVKELLSAKLIPQKMVDDLTAAVEAYNRTVGKITSSMFTAMAKQLDQERDNILLALKGLVVSARYRVEEEVRSAGRQLEEAIRHRGWQMQLDSYVAETNEINQLLGDIRDSIVLKRAVTTLNADSLIEQLERCNRSFEENERQRVAAEVAKGNTTSSEVVHNLQEAIQNVFGYLNSVSGVYPEVASAIDTLNASIETLVEQLKTRATIAAKKKQEAKSKRDEK